MSLGAARRFAGSANPWRSLASGVAGFGIGTLKGEMTGAYDVIVVGAGPAGSGTAIGLLLKDPNLRVLLLDKAVFPRDKSCGDAVGPLGVEVLQDWGLTGELFAGATRVESGVIIGPRFGPIQARMRDRAAGIDFGYVIPRLTLDHRLVEVARRLGADVVEDWKLRAIGRNSDVWELHGIHRTANSTYRGRVLVGADGAHSLVRRMAGLPAPKRRDMAMAIRNYGQLAADPTGSLQASGLVVYYSGRMAPAYGWAFPVGQGRVNWGVGHLRVDRPPGGRTLRNLLHYFRDCLADEGLLLEETEAPKAAALPLGTNSQTFTFPGGALVGDAANMINPLSGEGIAYALVAAEMLSREVVLKFRISEDADYTDYEREFRQRFGEHYRSNFIASRALGVPWIGALQT